jgi:hypothetical protein
LRKKKMPQPTLLPLVSERLLWNDIYHMSSILLYIYKLMNIDFINKCEFKK